MLFIAFFNIYMALLSNNWKKLLVAP